MIVEWPEFYMNLLNTAGHLFCRADREDVIEWYDNFGNKIEESNAKFTVRDF